MRKNDFYTCGKTGEAGSVRGAVELCLGDGLPQNARISLCRGLRESQEESRLEGCSVLLEEAEAGDVYTCRIAAPGFCTLTQRLTITEADLAAGAKQIDLDMLQIPEKGIGARKAALWTPELEQRLFSPDTLHLKYTPELDTPAFGKGKGGNEFTSVEEGTRYLEKVCRQNRCARLFFLDREKTWPAVVLTGTDLTACETLDDALRVLKYSRKLKVLYQAQIHGNEPAAGEGALLAAATLAEEAARGKDGFLSGMDVVLVPYVNRYGTAHFRRGGNARRLDLNRDGLLLRSPVTRTMHQLFRRLMPDVFLDGHEYNGTVKTIGDEEEGDFLKWLDDVQITCVCNFNRRGDFGRQETELVVRTLETLREEGLRTFMFKNSCDSTTSCSFARLMNCFTFIIESNGIGVGKARFERRVLAQHEAVTGLLKEISAEADRIKEQVSAARKELIRDGRAYLPADRFVLEHGASGHQYVIMPRPDFTPDGEIRTPGKTERFDLIDRILWSRSRPAAYILDRAVSGSGRAKKILMANGASCFTLPEKIAIRVRTYIQEAGHAGLGKEEERLFPKGAYVFPMDQAAANIISASLEPDPADTAASGGSFVQAGLLQPSQGVYPVFRFEGDNISDLVTAGRKYVKL